MPLANTKKSARYSLRGVACARFGIYPTTIFRAGYVNSSERDFYGAFRQKRRINIYGEGEIMKGIVLAGGSGTRLYPPTMVTSKQLLPVYDKPMIYYPLSVLMTAGIREILIISTPRDGSAWCLSTKRGRAVSIEEKPEKPKSNYCVTGLYFYDGRAAEFAKSLTPSARGELEITDLNKAYLARDELDAEVLGEEFTWLDTGTHESLAYATEFVKRLERNGRKKLACLEEISYRSGWIGAKEIKRRAKRLGKNQYGRYVRGLLGKKRGNET